MNSEIIDKIDEINLMIEKSKEYQKYQELQKQISKNKEIQLLINEIKVLQKDVTHHLDKKDELKRKEDELKGFPLYREYLNTLDELNNTYTIIENSLNHYFDKLMN